MATTPQEAYDDAMAYFRLAASAYRQAEVEYRARRIDDLAFLEARRLFDEASIAADAAEARLLARLGG